MRFRGYVIKNDQDEYLHHKYSGWYFSKKDINNIKFYNNRKSAEKRIGDIAHRILSSGQLKLCDATFKIKEIIIEKK